MPVTFVKRNIPAQGVADRGGFFPGTVRNLLGDRRIHLAALTAFLLYIGIDSLRTKYCVLDPDIWWHLKVGDWIVHHFALPHNGIFSWTAGDRPWVAYSWGYEVLLSFSYSWFGVVGVGAFGTALAIAVAVSTHLMLRQLSERFWLSLALAAVTCGAFLFNGAPRPAFFTYNLFCVTLSLLLTAQRSGRVQALYSLPVVFLVWVNLHIQFVYGLFVVALFVGAQLVQHLLAQSKRGAEWLSGSALPAKPLLVILALCALATLAGPNFYHPYLVVLAYTKAKFAYKIIRELQPMPFRSLSNFLVLFLAGAAFCVLGWRKKIDLFKISLLTISSAVAFRTVRDGWFICLPAAACIADFSFRKTYAQHRESWRGFALVTFALPLLLFFSAHFLDFNRPGLERALSSNYPVAAVNFLRQGSFSGPLYNNLNWGGFLMWYCPELPVSIDGRNDLYGDDLDELFYSSQSPSLSALDPFVGKAGIVLLESRLPLAKKLVADPRFRLVYQDGLATIFVRR